MKQGRWLDVEALIQRVIELRKAKFGIHHHGNLVTTASLAQELGAQNRREEDGRLHAQWFEKSRMELGADHRDTLRSMALVALAWEELGRTIDVLVMLRECFDN